MASKIVKARAHAAQVRVGKQAIADTLKTEARGAKKLEKAMTAATANPAEASPFCYAVMVDAQGVAYLRVEETEKGSRFIVATGAAIEVVEMDAATIRSRALKVVPEASVLEATEILARPLTKSVIISKRANEYLNMILNNKEFTTMATATKKAAKKAATKTSAAAKTGPSKAKTTGASRGPKTSIEDRFKVAKGIIGGKKEISKKDFAAELKKVYPNFYSSTKRLLIDGGYLKVGKDGQVQLAK